MWGSFENIDCLVKENGMLYLALYNKGKNHVHWSKIKKLYVNSSKLLKYIILLCSFVIIYAKLIIKDFIKLKPFQSIKFAKINRGMTAWHDLIDWVGGFPYETATADEIFTYFKKRKYNLEKIRTVGSSLNCNEFLFIKRIH
jgi:2-polyprenyl-6-hydroxyphenyl methylase/3-demethylubiquinone-9 3-methyltransferase